MSNEQLYKAIVRAKARLMEEEKNLPIFKELLMGKKEYHLSIGKVANLAMATVLSLTTIRETESGESLIYLPTTKACCGKWRKLRKRFRKDGYRVFLLLIDRTGEEHKVAITID